MDWKKEAQRVTQAMQEHKRKLETDPEYRKRSEERRKLFRDVLFLGCEEREEARPEAMLDRFIERRNNQKLKEKKERAGE